MENIKILFRDIKNKWKKNEISAYASSMAFFLFLSLIPLLLFISSLLPLTPVDEKSFTRFLEEMVPSRSSGWIINLAEHLYRKRPGLLSFSFIITMWSSGKGMMAFIRALNAIHNIEERRGYFRLRIAASLYTVVAAIAFLLSLCFKVFGQRTIRWLLLTTGYPEEAYLLLKRLGEISMPIVLFLCFLSLYTLIPSIKVALFSQFPGALFATFSWTIFSYGFSLYVENFHPFWGYGIFGIVLLILLWLYFGSYILLLGGIINTLKKK